MIIPQTNFLAGANASVSPLLQPENSPTVLNGVNNAYELGALLKDTGYSQVGDTLEAGKSITGLYDFHQSPTTQKILATVNNAAGTNLVLAYNNAGTWTDINIGSAWDAFEDCKVEMEGFIGYCFFVGYDSTDKVFLPVGSLTGTTFSTSTNVTDMPQGKFIKRYRDRLYIAHCYYSGALYQYRVYYSSVPVAGAIEWTPATDFLDVDFGREITGMGTNWDRLVVFTEQTAHIYDQSIWKKLWDTGCTAHRTIVNKGPYMYWFDGDNAWRSSGGQPEPIGGPIVKFIKAGNPRNFFSCETDEEIRTYVGTITVNGVQYTNCELIFNIPTQSWRWREFYDNFTIYAPYNNGGKVYQYMGVDDGEVMCKGKYTDTTLISSDDGYDIAANFELPPIWLNSEKVKRLKKVTAIANRAQGLNLQARVVDRNIRMLTPYKPLGKLIKYINDFDVNVDNGVMIQIAGSESSQLPYFSLLGLLYDIELYSNIPKK
jgi:hypothetical protein